MSINSEAVKKTAKTSLKGKNLKAIICSTVFIFAYLLCIYLGSLFDFVMGTAAYYVAVAIISIFVLMPLFLGVLRYFWRLLFGAEEKTVVVFYYFSKLKIYKKALRFIVLLVFKLAIWGIVLYIPSIILDFFAGTFLYNALEISPPIWISGLWPVSSFLKIIALAGLIAIALKYYIAPVLFIADEDMDCAEAIHMSTIISKGAAMDFVYLFFSMIGWIFICLFLIPTVFVLPYLICSYLIHVRFAVAKYNKHILDKDNGIPTYAV